MKLNKILESIEPDVIKKRFQIIKSLLLGRNTVQGISHDSKASAGTVTNYLKLLEKLKIVNVDRFKRESEPAMPHVGGVSVGYNEYHLTDEAGRYFSRQVDLWEKEPTHDPILVKEIRELLSRTKDKLFKACEIGDIETVKEIISIGYNIDIKDKFGYTALFNATEYQHKNIVELLVQNKADYNYVYLENIDSSYYNKSSYNIALEHGYKEIIKIYLKHGANCDEAFRTAARTGNIELFESVLPYSKKLDPKYLGELLLIASDWEALEESEKNKFAKTNKFAAHMIDLGADVNYVGEENKTPFYNALSLDNKELMNLLLDKGADLRVDIKNNEGGLLRTLLDKQDLDLLKKVIELGVNLCRSITSAGETPLAKAIHDGNDAIVELLLNSGVKVKNDKEYEFEYAIEKGSIELIGKLIDLGSNVNKEHFEGRTPIYYCKNKNVFYYLLEKGAKVDALKKNGDSLLHEAAKNGNYEIAKYLVENKLDINREGNMGYTPLHWAVMKNHFDIVKLLVANGALINVKGTAEGHKRTTPISIAKDMDLKEIYQYLESKSKEQKNSKVNCNNGDKKRRIEKTGKRSALSKEE